ncbi:MAG: hypothetical protein RH860_13790 [Cytophagales bacterium]
MYKILFSFLLLCFSTCSFAQSDAFDFWIGDWELTWQGTNNEIQKGENKIESILNKKVIQENFTSLEGDESSRFKGKSWTVYNPNTDKWKQTWVDNSGAYLDFEGFFEDDLKGFKRSFTDKNGTVRYQRMIFYEIKEASFVWDWQSSPDAKNWTLVWRINYQRKSK